MSKRELYEVDNSYTSRSTEEHINMLRRRLERLITSSGSDAIPIIEKDAMVNRMLQVFLNMSDDEILAAIDLGKLSDFSFRKSATPTF